MIVNDKAQTHADFSGANVRFEKSLVLALFSISVA